MNFTDINDLIKKLRDKDTVEQTKLLTQFYIASRFKLNNYDFEVGYVDGKDDGGLDFVYQPDSNSYYILQSKFTAIPKKVSFIEIKNEIIKIFKTILQENTNKKAEGFVNSLKRNITDSDVIVTINWLTTNIVPDQVVSEAQKLIDSTISKNNIKAIIDFIPIDKEGIDRTIYDYNHDFVPQTGRKILPITDYTKDNDPETSINSIVTKVKILDILKWFKNKEDIDNYLQKNVRGFIGGEDSDKTINNKIKRSFKDQPRLFWYKHNGIIIFVDSFRIEDHKLILINPQIVNGGQTVTTIFSEWDKSRVDNNAEVLIRVYRQSYEDTETFERTIEIVAALNSQNKVNPSDLKSNDQVQVNIGRLLSKYNYEYIRKRKKNAKSSTYKIRMVDLAKVFYCCLTNRPDIAARGNVEKLFEDKNSYGIIFNKDEIARNITINHRIIQYITAWCIYNNRSSNFILSSNKDKEYYQYSQYYILSEIYQRVWDWKLRKFADNLENWIEFVQSEFFGEVIEKCSRPMVRLIRELLPSDVKPSDYYRSKEAVRDFGKKVKRLKVDPILKTSYAKFRKWHLQ